MTYPPSRPSRHLILALLLLTGLCFTLHPSPAVADDLALDPPFIDELDETTGSISGSVTEEATGEPLAAQVAVWSESGSLVTTRDAVGDYEVDSLVPGRYYVAAVPTPSNAEHLAELYDDVPCPHGVCDLTTGTLVSRPRHRVHGGRLRAHPRRQPDRTGDEHLRSAAGGLCADLG